MQNSVLLSQQFLVDDTVDLLEELPRRSGTNINRYTKGQIIFGAGSGQGQSIHLVESGQILLKSMAPSGRFIALDVIEQEDVIGLELLIGPYTTTPVCGSDCETFSWDIKDIKKAMVDNPRLGIAISRVLATKCERLKSSVEIFASMNIPQRLAAFLKQKACALRSKGKGDADGTVVLPPYTHELLSDFIGTSREIITHYMTDFRREGYLTYSRRFIRVTNPEGLLQWTMGSDSER